jgi:hypothetical protein
MRLRLTWLRSVLTGLTTRGRSFAAAGVAAGMCAFFLGQRDLMRVAILLIVLPVAAALALTQTRYRLALTRTIASPRVAVGTRRIRLEIETSQNFPHRCFAGTTLVRPRCRTPLLSSPGFLAGNGPP